jgi:hypothetical protein
MVAVLSRKLFVVRIMSIVVRRGTLVELVDSALKEVSKLKPL